MVHRIETVAATHVLVEALQEDPSAQPQSGQQDACVSPAEQTPSPHEAAGRH
jgi:hypothetical protein